MAPIDVEKAIEELTLGEKVALTAGKHNFHLHDISTCPSSNFCPHQPPPLENGVNHAAQDTTSGIQHPFRA